MTVEGKFLENEIYYSNNKDQYPTGYKNFNYELSYNFINSIFINNQELIINSNMNRIISYINILNSCEKEFETLSKIENLYNLLEKISLKISLIANNLDLILIFASVVDRNLVRYYKSGENINNMLIVNQNGVIWKNIINSVYSTLISGQDVAFITEYNRVTISKISRINLKSIKLITKNEDGQNIIRIDSNYVESDSTNVSSDSTKMKDCSFAVDADVCIEKDEISSKLDYYNTTEIGIFTKVDDLPIVPNQSKEIYLFSINSVKVSIIENFDASTRRLSEGNSTMAENLPSSLRYLSILNLDPDMETKTFQNKIPGTTCVLYGENLNSNATACKSWYEYTAKVVLCDCSTPGLVANLYDLNATALSRVAQFPPIKHSIFNKYSMGILLSLIFIVSFLYLIGSRLDKREGYTKKHKVSKYYDLGQSLIINYTKLGFHKTFGLFKLFLYMVKMTHPLMSIFFIYSPLYSRGLRVLDLYILIKISFLFSMLPFYLTDNSDFEDVKNKRSFANMNKGPGDLGVALKKIAMSVVYSISGAIMSKLVTGFLNAIYYQNILEYESNEKYKYMLKTLKKTYHEDVFVYTYRMRNAYFKMKTLVKIRNLFKDIIDNRNKPKAIRNPSPKRFSFLEKYRRSRLENRDELRSEIKALVMTQLHEISNNKMSRNSDVNEIMSPQPYYDVSVTDEFKLNMSGIYSQDSIMVQTQRFTLLRQNQKTKRGKIKSYQTNQSNFGYAIGANKKRQFIPITALQIMDKEMVNQEYSQNKKRSSLKTKLFVMIFISSYIFLVIEVTNIYNKYEDNIFKICISPLLSVVISRFLITQNVMIFVHSFFMYKFGEKYYADNRKTLNPIGAVFKYVIPPISKANHKALLTFQKIQKRKSIAQ